jgi:hypothetical protein
MLMGDFKGAFKRLLNPLNGEVIMLWSVVILTDECFA